MRDDAIPLVVVQRALEGDEGLPDRRDAQVLRGERDLEAKVLDKKDKTQIRRASKFLNQHLLKWARQEDAEYRPR
jgi:hypothetical protein